VCGKLRMLASKSSRPEDGGGFVEVSQFEAPIYPSKCSRRLKLGGSRNFYTVGGREAGSGEVTS